MTPSSNTPAAHLGGHPTLVGKQVSAATLAAVVERQGAAETLQSLRGEFALALPLAPDRWLLAVDRFAVRTLCWRLIDGRLHFAERADDLARLPPRADIDPQAVYDYLHFHAIPSPRTVFKGVQRLPPAHFALLQDGQVQVKPYWIPSFVEPATGDFQALAEEFRHVLKDAVASQLDGTKAACYLSGGTDSSTVAGLIGQVTGRPAACYSIGFKAQGYDEMAFARLAAKRFGCEHHEYYVTPDDLLRSMPAVACHYDQPFGNSSALPAYYCARMAQQDGVTRILAGDGGDELFGGNARYAKQRMFGWYGAIPAGVGRGLLEPLLLSSPVGRLPLLKKGASYVGQARVPMPDRLEIYNLLHRVGQERVLSPAFLAQVDRALPLAHQRATWAEPVAGTAINRTLAFDWRYTLAESDLPKVVGSAQLAGLEVGFPFLQQSVLDFSMRLPPSYKLKGLKLRWFFKEALRGFLPDEILTKKKQGFGLPFGVWAVQHPGLRRLAQESLSSLAKRGYVQPPFVGTLLDELLPAHPGYYGELVWILTMLELWLQQHER